MKINLSKEHIDKIRNYIESYQKISNEEHQIYEKVKTLQEELNDLTSKLNSIENNLQSMRNEENIFIDKLHEIYGDFTLSDLWETIFLDCN